MTEWSRKNPGKVVLAIIAALLLLLALLLSGISRGTCLWYGYQTDRDTKYAAFVGCMVKVNETWVPRTELRTQQ